jgi:hypothetical protein
MMKRRFIPIFTCFLLTCVSSLYASVDSVKTPKWFGYGATLNNDLYQRYTNPQDRTGTYRSSGSAILNLAAGPKIWVGGMNASLSLEALAGIGFLGMAVRDYKGLGVANFPMMAKLNFGGLSGLDKEGRMGWHIGAGIQYSRTELFGLDNDFEKRGVNRGLHRIYLAQFGYGFGLTGFGVSGIVKYGFNPDTKANFAALGLQWDFNVPLLKKIATTASSL